MAFGAQHAEVSPKHGVTAGRRSAPPGACAPSDVPVKLQSAGGRLIALAGGDGERLRRMGVDFVGEPSVDRADLRGSARANPDPVHVVAPVWSHERQLGHSRPHPNFMTCRRCRDEPALKVSPPLIEKPVSRRKRHVLHAVGRGLTPRTRSVR